MKKVSAFLTVRAQQKERPGPQPEPETAEKFRIGMSCYTSVCSLEHKKDMSYPLLGITESTGYFRGVIATKKNLPL